MTYASFTAWIDAEVLQLRDQTRLDGAETGGNRAVAGRFKRLGTTWKVHADTHLEPLLMAFEAERRGEEPFQLLPGTGSRKLKLSDALATRHRNGSSYLYIYEIP